MSAREHYRGESDGLTDSDVLVGLIKVIDPNYKRPNKSLKTKVNDYKSCKQSKGQYLPFGNSAEITEFNNRVKTDYSVVLRAMTEFVQDFLEISSSGKREYKLITALLDLIYQDDSIEDTDCMYVLPDGVALPKSEIIKMQDVHLPAFLLGIWHFCNLERKNNRVGEPTYNIWCPENGGAPREYEGHMGEEWPTKIKLLGLNKDKKYAVEPEAVDVDVDDNAESKEVTPEAEPCDGSTDTDQNVQQNLQQINNPFTFIQNGNNNTQFGYVQNMVIKKE
jgi:hypothetical protein